VDFIVLNLLGGRGKNKGLILVLKKQMFFILQALLFPPPNFPFA